MTRPQVIRPADHAVFSAAKMGKSTIFESPHMLVGLNAFEPGQQHALHAHDDMDKLYSVVQGEGVFLLADAELPMRQGEILIAPAGVAHGIRNSSSARLVVLAVLAPSPR